MTRSSILFCAFVFALSSCGGTKNTTSSTSHSAGTWQEQPIAADGDSKDWPSPYPNYDNKGMIAYATSNDKENLYITVETGDETAQTKILKGGLTVWIDTSGGKEQATAINYPLQNDDLVFEMPPPNASKASEQTMMRQKQLLQKIKRSAKDATQLTLQGFAACNGGYLVNQANKCGIKVAMAIDEYNELVWEAVIPFKAIYNKDVLSPADAGRPISVCFAVKGQKKPKKPTAENTDQSTGMNTNAMRNSGTRGGGGGSGMRGRQGSGIDPMEFMFETTKTWKQFGLAYK